MIAKIFKELRFYAVIKNFDKTHLTKLIEAMNTMFTGTLELEGAKYIFHEGHLHNTEGPAVIESDGTKKYYYMSKKIECNNDADFFKMLNKMILG